VLVDATPPSAFTTLPNYAGFYEMFTTATSLFPGLTRFGVTRLINESSHPKLPAEAREQARADSSTTSQARSQRDEFAPVPTMMAQAGAVTDLGDLPCMFSPRQLTPKPVGSPRKWSRCPVRQQHPSGGRRCQPRITARQSTRRRRVRSGHRPHRGRDPDRNSLDRVLTS
jgi:hypothetical protein